MQIHYGKPPQDLVPGLYGLFRPLMRETVLDEAALYGWIEGNWRDAVTLAEGDTVCGCGYLDHVFPGRYGTVHVAAKKGLNYFEVIPLCRKILTAWFDRYALARLIGYIPVWDLGMQAVARACGFVPARRLKSIGKWVLTKEGLRT